MHQYINRAPVRQQCISTSTGHQHANNASVHQQGTSTPTMHKYINRAPVRQQCISTSTGHQYANRGISTSTGHQYANRGISAMSRSLSTRDHKSTEGLQVGVRVQCMQENGSACKSSTPTMHQCNVQVPQHPRSQIYGGPAGRCACAVHAREWQCLQE